MLATENALAQPAHGDPAKAQMAQEEEEELGPEVGTKRPAGPDERAGHLLVHGRFGYNQPFGSTITGVPATRLISGGPAFGAHLGIGLSRVTVLEATGSYALLR